MNYNKILTYKKFCKLLDSFPVSLFFYLIIVNLPSLPYIYAQFSKHTLLSIVALVQRAVFGAALISLIIMLMPNKFIKRTLMVVVTIFASVSFVLDFFAVYQYQHPFNSGMLDIALSTNSNEVHEYLGQYVTSGFLGYLAGVTIIVAIVLIVVKKIIRRWNVQRFIAVIIGLLLLVNVVDMLRLGLEQYKQHIITITSPLKLIQIIKDTYTNIKHYETYEARVLNNTVKVIKDDSDIPYVVFILGESTSRNHMSLYGYYLKTNPLLEKRKETGGLYVFTDVVSHHSHTLQVMRELFTFYRRTDTDEWYNHNNLFDILKQTDYKTAWLSNQESVGIFSLDKFYSRRCDYRHFTDVRESRDKAAFPDGVLLPAVKDIPQGEKNFILIHLMGTHGAYDNRYPKEYDVFQADDEDKGGDDEKRRIRAQYDNAVLYNDYIVDTLIENFADKDAIVIYVSDHADEVYEDRDFAGHTESMGTKHMIEIPCIIYTTQTFAQKRPQLVDRIARATDRPFMTDDMIHMLLDIMSIETPEYDPHKSLINDDFRESKRIYADKVYEK